MLHHHEEMFWLSPEEIIDCFTGTAVTVRLKDLVELWRAEFEWYPQGPPLPSRFVSFGPVYLPPSVAAPSFDASPLPSEALEVILRGTPCCGGVVRARVCVIHSPTDDLRLGGEMLVAERTDPGWVPLYSSVYGLLIERGSVLSHSAIVAHEMGKPTIVGIAGLCATLRDGDLVEMDGSTGIVRRLPNR